MRSTFCRPAYTGEIARSLLVPIGAASLQQLTERSASSAHDPLTVAATSVAFARIDALGVDWLTNSPVPSWPIPSPPQHRTAPEVSTAHASPPARPSRRTGPSVAISCGFGCARPVNPPNTDPELRPQQRTTSEPSIEHDQR